MRNNNNNGRRLQGRRVTVGRGSGSFILLRDDRPTVVLLHYFCATLDPIPVHPEPTGHRRRGLTIYLYVVPIVLFRFLFLVLHFPPPSK